MPETQEILSLIGVAHYHAWSVAGGCDDGGGGGVCVGGGVSGLFQVYLYPALQRKPRPGGPVVLVPVARRGLTLPAPLVLPSSRKTSA